MSNSSIIEPFSSNSRYDNWKLVDTKTVPAVYSQLCDYCRGIGIFDGSGDIDNAVARYWTQPDMAHPFAVTWGSFRFLDGLAYL